MNQQLPISSLTEGHLIDLEDLYDWLGLHEEGTCQDCDAVVNTIEFEYATVEGGELETNECYRLDTNQGSFGLPPDLLVTLR